MGRKKSDESRLGEPFTNEGASHSPFSPAVPVKPIVEDDPPDTQGEERSE
jgi:hypothetical protein